MGRIRNELRNAAGLMCLFFSDMNTKLLKQRIIRTRKILVFIRKSSVYFGDPPLLAYAGFSKAGGEPGNLRIVNTKRKISPLIISSFFCPKLDEDQKKKVFTQILSVSVLKLSAQVSKGGGSIPQFCLHTIIC